MMTKLTSVFRYAMTVSLMLILTACSSSISANLPVEDKAVSPSEIDNSFSEIMKPTKEELNDIQDQINEVALLKKNKPDSPELFQSLTILVSLTTGLQQIHYGEEAIALGKKLYGENNQKIADLNFSIANSYDSLEFPPSAEHHAKALPFYQNAITIAELEYVRLKQQAEKHKPEFKKVLSILASGYKAKQEYEKASNYYREMIQMDENKSDMDLDLFLTSDVSSFAECLEKQGKLKDANVLYKQSILYMIQKLQKENNGTQLTQLNDLVNSLMMLESKMHVSYDTKDRHYRIWQQVVSIANKKNSVLTADERKTIDVNLKNWVTDKE